MKYSDDMAEMLIQLENERKLFKEIIENAPFGQLISYIHDIGEQLRGWAEHPDFTHQEVIGYAVDAIIRGIEEDDQ